MKASGAFDGIAAGERRRSTGKSEGITRKSERGDGHSTFESLGVKAKDNRPEEQAEKSVKRKM